ncbi:MAG: acylglycerol kinase family protein [Ferruginibacter sp.]
MQRRFIFFYNPVSGTKSKEQLLRSIKKRCEAENVPYEIAATNAEGDYLFLKEKIVAEKITDVIVCGGDGTVNQFASTLLEVPVNIGIIPMGSGNGLALAAGIPRPVSKALDVIFKGNAVATDGFYINRYFSCMLCGLGFDAQVAHDFAKQGTRGLATYAKANL